MMHNFYGCSELTPKQKSVYLKLLCHISKSDFRADIQESGYIKEIMQRFGLSATDLKEQTYLSELTDLAEVLEPIDSRTMAIDLVHCLWFAAMADEFIAEEEIAIIRQIAGLLHLEDEVVLKISSFVSEEIAFIQQAEEVLETGDLSY